MFDSAKRHYKIPSKSG